MTKADLINAIHGKCNGEIPKTKIEESVNAAFSAITDELIKGGSITLTGFGTFSAVNRAARVGRNPKTGAQINIPAGRAVKFKVGKHLKEVLN